MLIISDKKLQDRQYTIAWNFWHPEELRGIPALVERETFSREIDDLDIWLGFVIAYTMLDD